MTTIFVCNTPYHVIVAHCIARNILKEDICDIFLSDAARTSYKIVKRLTDKSLCFRNIYYGETSKWQLGIGRYSDRVLKYRDDCFELLEKIDILQYDRCIYSVRDVFGVNMLDYIILNKPKMIIGLMEDGFSTYSYDKSGYLDGNKRESYVGEFYLFWPEYLSWQPKGRIIEVPRYFEEDEILKTEFNRIFGYYDTGDSYNYKYIFFESGFMGWENSMLYDLLENIAAIVGKENLLVKMHPRNQGDINLSEKGYFVNKDWEIPWEIIAMNMYLYDKILITNFSQSVITPKLLFNKKYKAIFLSEIIASNEFEKDFSNYMKNYVLSDNKNFFIPQNRRELFDFFKI